MKWRGIPAYSVLMLAAACGGDDASARAGSGGARKATVAQWDTLWLRGGETDSLLLLPLDVTANAKTVFILDGGGKRVVALNASDGSLAWTAGGPGAGPEEFRMPTAMSLTHSGNLLVADQQNGRISIVGPTGKVTGHILFSGYTYVQGLCSLADGSMLLTTLENDRPVLRVGPDGTVRERLDLPWPELRTVEPIARQGFLAGTEDFSQCVLTLATGPGFVRYGTGGFSPAYNYVEQIDPPEVDVAERSSPGRETKATHMRRRSIAATDASVSGGFVNVSFEGQSASAGRLIDRYDLRTGRYRETFQFTSPVQSIAQSGDTYLLLHQSAGYPILLAARPRAAAPGGENEH